MRGCPELIAADELHPSAKTYARWAGLIFPTAQELLGAGAVIRALIRCDNVRQAFDYAATGTLKFSINSLISWTKLAAPAPFTTR